jgi:hypothetical protein
MSDLVDFYMGKPLEGDKTINITRSNGETIEVNFNFSDLYPSQVISEKLSPTVSPPQIKNKNQVKKMTVSK